MAFGNAIPPPPPVFRRHSYNKMHASLLFTGFLNLLLNNAKYDGTFQLIAGR